MSPQLDFILKHLAILSEILSSSEIRGRVSKSRVILRKPITCSHTRKYPTYFQKCSFYFFLSSGLRRSRGKKTSRIYNWIWLPWIHHLSFSVLFIFGNIVKLFPGAVPPRRTVQVWAPRTGAHILILICHKRGPT